MSDVRAHVIVRGQVQGVFFRDSARREARVHHLAGWIRNRPDGAVEAVFQGEQAAVEALIRWCHTGPPHAVVTDVTVTWEPPVPDEASFRIR